VFRSQLREAQAIHKLKSLGNTDIQAQQIIAKDYFSLKGPAGYTCLHLPQSQIERFLELRFNTPGITSKSVQ
jgi:hypothetical protein